MSQRGKIFFPLVHGSLGDVLPTATVAVELRKLGFGIRILASPLFRGAAKEAGVDLSTEWTDLADPDQFESPWTPWSSEISQSRWTACSDAAASLAGFDAMVSDHHSMPYFLVPALAANIPVVSLCPMPLLPTREFNLFTRWPHMPKLNRSLWRVGAFRAARMMRQKSFGKLVQHLPPELKKVSLRDLEDFYRTRVFHCVNVSPSLLKRPRDWDANIAITGYCWPRRTPPPLSSEIVAFLERGEPPVLVSFGSAQSHPLAGSSRGRRLSRLLAGLRASGRRAIIQLPQLETWPVGTSTSFLMLDAAEFSVPHESLLPYCDSLICHGGAGTVHTAVRAGLPIVVRPRITDQFFWADRLATIGVSPAQRRLSRDFSASGFAKDLSFARKPSTRMVARTIGQRVVHEEDGTSAAAQYIAERIGPKSADDVHS